VATPSGSCAKASRTRAFGEISVTVTAGWAVAAGRAGVTPRAKVTGADNIGTGKLEAVERVSNTTASGSFRSEWIRTGGKSVAEVSVLGSGIGVSAAFAIKSSPSNDPPT
jgi:hypothetical protein